MQNKMWFNIEQNFYFMLKVRLNLMRVVAIAICLASNVTMFAQDIITMKNGDEIQAVVQEVGIDDIKYKRFDNPNGPNYTLKKSEIFMIKYENGSKDVFNETATSAPANGQQTTVILTQSELSYSGRVWQNGIKLRPEQVRTAMSGNTEALQQYNNGRSLYVAGMIIAYPSALLMGWDLGTRLGGGEGNGILLGVGITGTVVGLIMGLTGESQIKQSVQLYNSKASNTSLYQINFGFTQTGVGLCMQF